jgi:hypothetical protein
MRSARAQLTKQIPAVDPIIMAILPHKPDTIVADLLHVHQHSLAFLDDGERKRFGRTPLAAAAGSAGARPAQVPPRIHALMTVLPFHPDSGF